LQFLTHDHYYLKYNLLNNNLPLLELRTLVIDDLKTVISE
jgi:hypothetical protein